MASASLLDGGLNDSSALAERDTGQAFAFAEAAQDDLVAVGEEFAEVAGGQAEGDGAALGDFEHAALRAGMWAGDGAAGQDVSGEQIAAVAGVVREHLREGPVEVAKVAGAEPGGWETVYTHVGGGEEYFKGDVEA